MAEGLGRTNPTASVTFDEGFVEGNTELRVGISFRFGWRNLPAILAASLSCENTDKKVLPTNSPENHTFMST